jgi:hypothetical protein
MAIQSIEHCTDLHDLPTKIHGIRPRPAPDPRVALRPVGAACTTAARSCSSASPSPGVRQLDGGHLPAREGGLDLLSRCAPDRPPLPPVAGDRAGAAGQLQVPADEIGADVSLDHPLDAQAPLPASWR